MATATVVQPTASQNLELQDEIRKQFAALKEKRTYYEPLWQKVLDLLFSLSRDIYMINRHLVVNNSLYDGSGMSALRTFAAGLIGNMVPRDQAWFTLRYRDPKRNQFPGVSAFQKDMEDVIYSMLDQSNFYEFTNEFAVEGGWACTAAAYIQPRPETQDINFTMIPTGTYWINQDSNGVVDTLFREFMMEGRELLKLWGDALSPDKRSTYEQRPFEEFKILHAVRPREKFTPGDGGNKNFAFESTYWLESDFTLLEESGYRLFPFLVWRVERNLVSPWGRGPGFNVLRDLAIMQRVAQDMLLADQKLINPAWEVPEELSPREGREDPYVTHPDGINYVPLSAIGKSRPVQPGIQRVVGVDREERLRKAVENHFFVPFFLMQNQVTHEITIPEYMGRAAEQGVILAPLSNRFSSEVVDHMMKLVVQYASDFRILPQPPDAVLHGVAGSTGGGMDVNYVGPLATLQKRAQTMSGVQAFIQTFGELKQTMPENGPMIDDNVDVDQVVSLMAEANGVQVLLNDKATIADNRKLRQQAQAMMAQEQAKAQAMQATNSMKQQPRAPGSMGAPNPVGPGPGGMGGAF